MKAAVLHKAGDFPRYENFAEPVLGTDEVLVTMKAASIKNLDRMRVKGTHYDKYTNFPAVVGVDGVGVLPDGTRVYTGGDGMMAQQIAVNRNRLVNLPDNIDDITAAAIPNPGISAWLTLAWKGRLKKGDAVLILGATGITGTLAVQIAKHLGAGKIVVTGRNPASLQKLTALGADVAISLQQSDEAIMQAIATEAQQQPFDIVIDYLWGKPAELVLEVLTGHNLNSTPHLTRYIQVGEMAGAAINLKAATLRSSLIEITGVGGGSIPMDIVAKIGAEYLPEIFRLAAEGKLTIDTEAIPLKDVEQAWQQQDLNGKRIVLTM